MEDTRSSVSATDLLDAYLDKQLNGVDAAVSLPDASRDEKSSTQFPSDFSLRPPFSERISMGSISDDAGRDFYEEEIIDRSVCEKLEELKCRCRMLDVDLPPMDQWQLESEEMMRKLESLKTSCRQILKHKPRPQPIPFKNSHQNVKGVRAAFKTDTPSSHSSDLVMDSASLSNRGLTAEDIRIKYPHLFSNDTSCF